MIETLKRIFGYARPYKRHLFAAIIFSFTGVTLSLFVPVLIGDAVDLIVSETTLISKDFWRYLQFLAELF